MSLFRLYIPTAIWRYWSSVYMFVLKISTHIKRTWMYYYSDPLYDQYHLEDAIPLAPRLEREVSLSIDLYYLYEITITETTWKMETMIKLPFSPEMTKCKMWPCQCMHSYTCYLRLADLRMSASCLASATLSQSRFTLISPKINGYTFCLVSREATYSVEETSFQTIFRCLVLSVDGFQ